jgi:hypothetical protein
MRRRILNGIYPVLSFVAVLSACSTTKPSADDVLEEAIQEAALPVARAAFEACPKIVKLDPAQAEEYARLIRTEKYNDPISPRYKDYLGSLVKMKADKTFCGKLLKGRDVFRDSPFNSRYFLWI